MDRKGMATSRVRVFVIEASKKHTRIKQNRIIHSEEHGLRNEECDA